MSFSGIYASRGDSEVPSSKFVMFWFFSIQFLKKMYPYLPESAHLLWQTDRQTSKKVMTFCYRHTDRLRIGITYRSSPTSSLNHKLSTHYRILLTPLLRAERKDSCLHHHICHHPFLHHQVFKELPPSFMQRAESKEGGVGALCRNYHLGWGPLQQTWEKRTY